MEVDNIKHWLLDKGSTLLWDLSAWEDNNWISWDLGDLPPDLNTEAEILTNLLQENLQLKKILEIEEGGETIQEIIQPQKVTRTSK